MIRRRPLLCALAGALLSTVVATQARGQAADYPTRPITLIAPFSPAGASDLLARIVAEQLHARLGRPVIVENRPGANTLVATQHLLKAAPDGYTLMMMPSLTLGLPLVNPAASKLDLLRDLTPIGRASNAVMVLVANREARIDSVAGLIAAARANPGAIVAATTGIGSSDDIALRQLAQQTGTEFNLIAYNGGAPAIQAVLAGQAQVRLDALPSSKALIDAGKLKLLAVLNPERVPALPGVPTIAETVPGVAFSGFYGLVGPKSVPQPIVRKLNAALNEILRMPEVVQRLAPLGLEPAGGTPETLTEIARADHAARAAVIRKANLKFE